jgi:hypothetical protein
MGQTSADLYKAQERWDALKAVVGTCAAVAVTVCIILALANWLPTPPQTINVHLDGPIVIQIVPAGTR